MKRCFLWTLTLLVSVVLVVPTQAQEEKFIKRKVAIGRFTNETQYAKGLFYDKENDPMQKQIFSPRNWLQAANSSFWNVMIWMC